LADISEPRGPYLGTIIEDEQTDGKLNLSNCVFELQNILPKFSTLTLSIVNMNYRNGISLSDL